MIEIIIQKYGHILPCNIGDSPSPLFGYFDGYHKHKQIAPNCLLCLTEALYKTQFHTPITSHHTPILISMFPLDRVSYRPVGIEAYYRAKIEA